MGKRKKSEQLQRESKKDQRLSKKKVKRDGKPRQVEHLEHIPFRLREIMKTKERMKLGSSKRKQMARARPQKANTGAVQSEDIPVPKFQRGKHESERSYIWRMNQEVKHVRFLTMGQVERRPEQEQQEQPANRRKSEKNKEFHKARAEKMQQKKMAKREETEEKQHFTDKVQFGEVAMAPPCLTAKPRKAPTKAQGAAKGLLLNSLLGHTSLSTNKTSMARQKMMAEERERVIAAYRHLKMLKQEQYGSRMVGNDKQAGPQ